MYCIDVHLHIMGDQYLNSGVSASHMVQQSLTSADIVKYMYMYSTSTGTLATAWTLSKEAIQSVVKGLLNHIQRRQAVSTD